MRVRARERETRVGEKRTFIRGERTNLTLAHLHKFTNSFPISSLEAHTQSNLVTHTQTRKRSSSSSGDRENSNISAAV